MARGTRHEHGAVPVEADDVPARDAISSEEVVIGVPEQFVALAPHGDRMAGSILVDDGAIAFSTDGARRP